VPKKILNTIIRIIIFLIVLAAAAVFLPRLVTALYAETRIYTAETAPPSRVAIVFGAGLSRDGSPSPVLRDRVATAAELYFSGKIEKLLMSGDNRFIYYNEPEAMRQYALELGVSDEDIVLDYAGRRTYDTCYRAKYIFNVEEATLVTQSYHLPRALFTCNQLGVSSAGVSADLRSYSRRSFLFWNIRELPATLSAFWEVFIIKPFPVLGDREPIFAEETSWNVQKHWLLFGNM